MALRGECRLAAFAVLPALALAVIVTAAGSCRREDERARATHAPPAPSIPHVTAPIELDGEWDEPDWSKRAVRGQFRGSDGQLARPSSEIRLLADDDQVWVGLYAADDDIRSTDAFAVTIGAVALQVSAAGTLSPSLPGVRAAVDRDGSLDDGRNFDEEWVIELAIPRAQVPAHGVFEIHASRCDTPKHGVERCGAWSGTVELAE